jgi:DNA-binding transcriptional LysR family regulator
MPIGYNRRMELRHLRYFVAVAETENVSKAAAALRLSQPALSRQLHDLEAELKVALFERTGRNLRLTGAGEDLLAYGRRVLDQAGAFRERARAIGGGQAGVLRVGATPQTLQRLFPAIIQRFRRIMPAVELRLTEGDADALVEALRRGDLHLAFTGYRPEFGAACVPAGAVPMLVIGDGQRVRGRTTRGTIEIGALEDVPLLLLHSGYGSRTLFDAACRVARIRTNVFLESNAPDTLLALVKAGCGLAVLPGTVSLPRDGLRVRRLMQGGKPVEMPVVVHWNPRQFLPPYAERFAEELAQHARGEFSRTNR